MVRFALSLHVVLSIFVLAVEGGHMHGLIINKISKI